MTEPTTPAPPPPPPPPSAAPSTNTLMLILSYLGPFALVPYLAEKNDAEVQWHAKNGMVLFLAELVLCIGLSVVSFLPGVPCGGGVLGRLGALALLGLHIVCIVKAVQGQRLLIPGLSPFVDKF